ncbi:MAG TPA: NUDIX domain-containing protein [Burkholderiaceae bacterium]
MSGAGARATVRGRPVTQVAVGVVLRDDGAVLLADRPAGKPYAGYWEFPGGKIEPGEPVETALARELGEELGITIGPSLPWVVYEHDYPHAYVRLHFRRIFEWSGVPHPVEGQRLRFCGPRDEWPSPLLPAAGPACRWLRLPSVYAMALAGAGALQSTLESALERGLRMARWHEPSLNGAALAQALDRASALARAYGAGLLVSSHHPRALWRQGGGVHFEAGHLRSTKRRPRLERVGASAADRVDLVHAAAIGCDFAVVEEVAAEALCKDAPLPVYVRGRVDVGSLRRLQQGGAHGVAADI